MYLQQILSLLLGGAKVPVTKRAHPRDDPIALIKAVINLGGDHAHLNPHHQHELTPQTPHSAGEVASLAVSLPVGANYKHRSANAQE